MLQRGAKSVALLARLDWGFSRAAIRGASLHAHTAGWHLHLGPPVPDIIPLLREWSVDGVIGYVPSESFRTALTHVCPNVVSLSNIVKATGDGSDRLRVVSADDAAVGAMAAQHFIERRFRHFAYLGYADMLYSVDRERGFCEKVRLHGMKVAVYHAARPSANTFPRSLKAFDDGGLAKWLREMPKPVAILTCHDACAMQLAETCRIAGLAVPEQVAIVGVDDDEALCLAAWPPLSSVQLPAEQIGRQAALCLQRMMERNATEAATLLPPTRVVTRQSSDIIAVDDDDVAGAIRIIRDAGGCITVSELMQRLTISRRALQMKFHRLLGRSPLDEIRRTRVEHVQRLLTDTDLPIYEIARRTGFGSPKRLATVFAHFTGRTPTACRRGAMEKANSVRRNERVTTTPRKPSLPTRRK
ncbi:MAG TPA: XylR family transcriptional regulator [Tepidisphaeraceae bacterium]|nr:XylR family transcriptional regulator [Tepidisphaeraceae bacterium]